MSERGIAPVIAVVLVVAITVVLASTVAVGMAGFADFGAEEEQVEDLLEGTATPTADGSDDDADAEGDDGEPGEHGRDRATEAGAPLPDVDEVRNDADAGVGDGPDEDRADGGDPADDEDRADEA